jgi:hypothetical protein
MAYQASGVFTYFWVPSLIVLLAITASLVFPKVSGWSGLLTLLGRAAILIIPALLILVVGTTWLHWRLYSHQSNLPNLMAQPRSQWAISAPPRQYE